MPGKITQEEVKGFLKSLVDSYENASEEFFKHYKSDASLFTVSSPTRVDGVKEFRKGFRLEATAGKPRRSQILSPDIKLQEDNAIVTYHNRVMVEDVVMNLRVTLIIEKDDAGDLKILHQHTSPLTAQVVSREYTDLASITVLEERVATAAAMVGTPR